MNCPEISHDYVFDHADFDFVIHASLTLPVFMLLPVYAQTVVQSLFLIPSTDFSETWQVLEVIGLEYKNNFYHHFVLPVFEEQVRCHAPITLLQYKKLSIGAWLSVVDGRLMAKSLTLNFSISKTI